MSKFRLGIVIALGSAFAVFGVGCGGSSTTSSTAPATSPSTSTPAATQSTSTPAATQSTSTPTAPATGDALVGKTLFEAKCQGCHAKDGTEASVGPKLAGGGRSDERIRKQIVNGSPSSGIMPAGLYSGADLDDVGAFVLSIQ
jgi:mono/diheme cytochrome c family protein